jgi:hypothetical protein
MLGKISALYIFGSLLASCTTKIDSPTTTFSTQSEESLRGARSLENIDILPVCSENSDGQVIFIRDRNTFKICSGKAWLDKTFTPNKTIADVRKIDSADSSCPDGGVLILIGEDKY